VTPITRLEASEEYAVFMKSIGTQQGSEILSQGAFMTDLKEDVVFGVVCLHCRLQTPVAKSTPQASSEKNRAAFRPQVSIVRCAKCGGEAPYLVNELVAIKNVSSPRAWAA
jgi:hypothetical protein